MVLRMLGLHGSGNFLLVLFLLALEKEQQWHRIIQVIKWMLSKAQGNTMGTYGQLIRALDKDCRAEEAHTAWLKKVGTDLHSVPWKLCSMMISLFKDMEAFDRKLHDKVIVQRVANAQEILGMPGEKERVLQKYAGVLSETKKKKRFRKRPEQSATEGKQ
ncbi:unnamed protein product [Linum tenue]|uniref:Uncharacterized protein n=1 Tax=Linum tenue TaxID=586396 RepID=A0AAV0LCZ6_9ROSI|nr:unnamed protein product [Linum tenue]